MTISTTTRFITYPGNASATNFSFPFKVFATSELVVNLENDLTGVQTLQVLGTDYTAVLSAAPNSNPGGSITFILTAPPVGVTVIITSNIALEQPTNLSNQGGFYPDVINNSLDRATIQIQQVANLSTRALVVPITETGTNLNLPGATERALQYLIFDGLGNPALTPVGGGSVGNTSLQLLANIPSTSKTTGTLIVGPSGGGNVAGVGIGGRTFIGGTDVATATNTSGALNVQGGGYFASTCYINGMVVGNTPTLNGTFPANTTAVGVDANLLGENFSARSTVFGHSANKNNTSTGGRDVTAIGYRALQGNTEEKCTAVGSGAGYSGGLVNSSDGLTAVGYNAGTQSSGTTNNFITAIGTEAASSLTGTSNEITAVGYHALKDAAGALECTAVGYQALLNSSNNQCTAVGHQALAQSAPGASSKNQCTAVGHGAGEGSSGSSGTYIGVSAGSGVTTSGVVAIGGGALSAGSSANLAGNIYIGLSSGVLATGAKCIAIGANSMGYNASRSVAIGHNAGYLGDTNTTNNVLIGTDCAGLHANGFRGIDTVGIGELCFGDTGTGSGVSNAGTGNVAIGKSAMYGLKTGAFNTCVGRAAGSNIVSGSNNIYIGNNSGGDSVSVAAVSNAVVVGVADGTNRPTANGQTIIGNSSTITARIFGAVCQGVDDPALDASSGALTPTQSICRVTVTGAVATINVPWGDFPGTITLIPKVAFTTTVSGNIAVISTAVINKPLVMTYSSFDNKWYPSYT